jgi:hypothetical protein
MRDKEKSGIPFVWMPNVTGGDNKEMRIVPHCIQIMVESEQKAYRHLDLDDLMRRAQSSWHMGEVGGV